MLYLCVLSRCCYHTSICLDAGRSTVPAIFCSNWCLLSLRAVNSILSSFWKGQQMLTLGEASFLITCFKWDQNQTDGSTFLPSYLEGWVFLQPVPHAVTVLVQGGVQQPHPLLQALQCVLHQALLLSSTQSACSSTQKLSAQVYLPGHCLQLFIQSLGKKAEVSNITSRFLIM